MSMLAARTAQAALVTRIRGVLSKEMDPANADKILAEAIREDACAAGETFAGLAPGGPSLEHFATVLDRWREGDALTIEGVTLAEDSLSFAVTHCAYAQAYADLGLDPGLGAILSCSRDEPFAKGYSFHLSMERSRTIMEGAPRCLFTFTWRHESRSFIKHQ
jgi:hypothetical protein